MKHSYKSLSLLLVLIFTQTFDVGLAEAKPLREDLEKTAVQFLQKMPSFEGSNRELCLFYEEGSTLLTAVGQAGRFWNAPGSLYYGTIAQFPAISVSLTKDSRAIQIDYSEQAVRRELSNDQIGQAPIVATSGLAYGQVAEICIFENAPVFE